MGGGGGVVGLILQYNHAACQPQAPQRLHYESSGWPGLGLARPASSPSCHSVLVVLQQFWPLLKKKSLCDPEREESKSWRLARGGLTRLAEGRAADGDSGRRLRFPTTSLGMQGESQAAEAAVAKGRK